jgi:rhamnosyltransferase
MTIPGDGIAAIIVAYQPVASQINRLIAALSQQCRIVYVMDNGGGRDAIPASLGKGSVVRIVDMEGNQGIGAALNLGFQLAKTAAIKFVVTFDQDSEPPHGLAAGLMNALEQLTSNGERVAAVGPRIVDLRNARAFEYAFMHRRAGWPTAVRCARQSAFVEADFLITSGSLISLDAFERVGPFDQTLFVDCTDMEWCFRARAMGYRLYGVCSVVMPHELGSGAFARALGITILGHSPVRRYYYGRNTVRLLKLSHVALGWKIRMLLGLLARMLLLPFAARFTNGWRKDWLMLLRGAADGVAGTGGRLRP